MDGILDREKLQALEQAKGLTLKEAADIMKDLREEPESTDPMEREAILLLGTAWKCGYITEVLFRELYGMGPSH